MSYAIVFLSGVIFTFAAIRLLMWLADAAELAEHRRKVEFNRRTYEAYLRYGSEEQRKAA